MDASAHTLALKRLKTIEGHVRGIQRMLEQGEYCIDVMRQIQATQAALNKVNQMVLETHMHSCVVTAVRGEDVNERERVLKEIAEVYEAATKA
jgi:DNA-binding FrmR family transcriptional regulator